MIFDKNTFYSQISNNCNSTYKFYLYFNLEPVEVYLFRVMLI